MASANAPPDHASPPHPASGPSAIPSITATSPPPNKRDLKSWWKGFKLPSKHHESQDKPQGIFGVPLRQSITYANVAISLVDEKGESYIYGYVPIVVAKCGVYLKEKATGIEGIFRLSGSEKRIKELKSIFDSPDRYGKGLVWEGYTVHDAANILRRYLNDLPEPVVPLDRYEKFREPLRGATKQAVGDAEGPQFVENFDENSAIEMYQRLITELPALNRQLLLYILDLLAVFAAKSDENRMNSQNLAAIFQPGMLSHPAHAMAPEEYRLNQCVIIFLIENQDHFLIGMQGTAADEETKKEVELGTSSGLTTPNPSRKSGVVRSASSASAGADSVRREGKVRRNRSVSSRHSKQEGSTTPNSVAMATTPTSSLGRSNTVPSKKSPAVGGGKFKKHDSSGHLEPLTQVSPAEEPTHSEQSSLAPAAVGGATAGAAAAGRSQERLLEVPQEVSTPPKERNLPHIFPRLPTDSSDKRQPNKLKKKRIPGSLNPSAQSSSASLSQSHSNAASPSAERTNPLETMQSISTVEEDARQQQGGSQQPPSGLQPNSEPSTDVTPRASQAPSNNNLHPEYLLRGKKSPPGSLHSSFNEGSDMDTGGDELLSTQGEQGEQERKRRWRMSRSRHDDPANPGSPPRVVTDRGNVGSTDNVGTSLASSGSAANKPRKSFTGDSSDANATQTGADAGKDKDDSKGPIGWIRNKYREAKENAEQRRNKSPPADRPGQGTILRSRGKSVDTKSDQGVKEEGKEQEDTKEQEKENQEAQPAAPQPAAEPQTEEKPET